MKTVVYTDIINRAEKDARIKGCRFRVKVLDVEQNTWLTLYYRDRESAQKEIDRFKRFGEERFRHVTEIIPL
jgi:hypothetical protein